MPKTSTSFEPDNQAAERHGGEAGVKAIQQGAALTGPAAEAEQMVRAELETAGRTEIVTQAAVRLEAVARLYFNAFCDAAARGDLAQMDSYVKRYGWLQLGALRAWAQVRDEQGAGDDGSIEAALSSARGNNGNDKRID